MSHTAFIALGSNIGNRAANLHAALKEMSSYLNVFETSHLYETIPMLVTDQPLFLNAVCSVSTNLSPTELLQAVKKTEVALGRTQSIRYGPRVIDLDILFYDDAVIDTPELKIPHVLMPDRDFVLAPLLDLDRELLHPLLDVTVQELWLRLQKPVPPRVMPVGEMIWHWGQGTRVMGILNMTPDSFSGDGLGKAPEPLAAALAQASRFAAAGADILDIGGYSTRPGHVYLSVEEEIARVVPVITALRDVLDVPLSVDTFRVEVAEAALDAGAVWLNDVSGLRTRNQTAESGAVEGERPSQSSSLGSSASDGMAALSSRRRVPLVLMDNRAPLRTGPPSGHPQVDPPPPPSQPSKDIVADVRNELSAALELARLQGVPRWHRIIDPGIGFGKTPAEHAALISRLDEFQELGYPLLFGCSRKGFLGKMAGGVPVEDRLPATIAANTLAVERGAQIVRVHDVRENLQAMRVVDAILTGSSTRRSPSIS
ncbi:MAG: 2-amino-4-hydroxy-6-hydroxymethyldihydropteridine diphosphokinase [Caldilineaceae bacterium]|nr:2-amino-4-hydroxy-6-hydroxymethyldihydropteridine diphosphokinase [Caldilineaceae bacterium]